MGFWIFMLIVNLLIPVIMVGIGSWFIKSPPKEINLIYGYRTFKSMVNRETWIFAHNYCGRLWRIIGLIMLIPSVIAMAFVIDKEIGVIGIFGGILCGVQLVFLIIPIIFTEKALKANFDAQGNRRS